MITVPGKVRDIVGMDEELSIDDEQITTLIKLSERIIRRDMFEFHYHETVGCNPDTGETWNGSNTRFQIGCNIADYDFDETTVDDVTGVWLDSSFEPHDCSISVHDSRYGLIDVYQSDGSTPIPSTAEEVVVDYWNSDEIIPFSVLEEMGTLLTAHFVKLRLTEPKKISMADLESNKRLLTLYNKDFFEQYKDLVRRYSTPLLEAS